MHLGVILETNDAEQVWNGFRLANKALANGHEVDAFLLGAGVEAPGIQSEQYNPTGVLRKFKNEGGTLFACGTCMDSREIEPTELRPRSTMGDLLEIVERTDKTITFG
jgi:sulfur relay (sulfurtransferase) complex TusBCD TusD component (DsrE family)